MLYYAWTVETLNDFVDEELDALPVDMLVRFEYITRLIEEFGLERGPRAVVVRAFIKKTEKTPSREIELALRRAAEVR